MKSKEDSLKNRGFIKKDIESDFLHLPYLKILESLTNITATDRSLAARLLQNHISKQTTTALISALKKEQKLYAKIEICNALVTMDTLAIKPLIEFVGKIGKNQHKTVPKKSFLKDSYPLPRDIAVRVLIRIGTKALPDLLIALKTENKHTIPELLDAIGHINFYNPQDIFSDIHSCFITYNNDLLIKWKCIRAFSGIPKSVFFLNTIKENINNKELLLEVERSLNLLSKNNN